MLKMEFSKIGPGIAAAILIHFFVGGTLIQHTNVLQVTLRCLYANVVLMRHLQYVRRRSMKRCETEESLSETDSSVSCNAIYLLLKLCFTFISNLGFNFYVALLEEMEIMSSQL